MSRSVTIKQKDAARKLGLNVVGVSERVAAVLIRQALADVILHRSKQQLPTVRQIEFAKTFGIDVSNDSYEVAFAKIEDCVDDRNQKAIRDMNLRPGVEVELVEEMVLGTSPTKIRHRFVVSSIHPSGRVYFKGTTGHFAYASQLSLAKGVSP